jgi:hypothetical protein
MRKGGTVLALVLLALGSVGVGTASADEAAAMYDPGKVVFIDLTLNSIEEAKLEAEPEEYVKGTFSLTESSDGTPAGEEPSPIAPPRPVEVRLKGSQGGSFRDLTKKAAFKLKFKKADAFLGLRKMTLNNMVQDPSMLHETLAYAAFRAADVPASRTGYAYVRLNSDDLGVYLNLENLDDIGLARIFGSFDDETQHLYEGEKGHDVKPGEAGEFEVDEGSEEDIGDLEALIDSVNLGLGKSFSKRVVATADLAEMTKMWSVEKYIDHWDGYSGHAEAGLRPNNYYLYSEPSGRFQMLPWGTDQTWIPTIGVGAPQREVTFDGEGGVLFNKCLEDPECFQVYWEALSAVTQTIANVDPGALAEETAELLEPWQAEERAHGRPDPAADEAGEVEDGVEESLEFIAGRQAEADEWLAANEPPPIVDGTPAPPPGSKAKPTSMPPGPVASFEGVKRSGRYLATSLHLAAAGKVTLRVSGAMPQGERKVCAASRGAKAAGGLTIGCKLSNAAMDRLAHRALRLRLAITIALVDGRTKTIARSIRFARD